MAPDDHIIGGHEYSKKIITFICRMRSVDLEYGMHEDSTNFRDGVHNRYSQLVNMMFTPIECPIFAAYSNEFR